MEQTKRSQHDAPLFPRLLQRELVGGAVHRCPFIRDFSCDGECSGTILSNASTARAAPVFGLQYGSTYNKFLAAADEEGYVSIINTAAALPACLEDESSPSRPVAQWTAHNNAIFDFSWANSDRWMYTASGDMTLGLWDTAYASQLATFAGHAGSVKVLSVSPQAAEIFASGSRDGTLLVWDTRVNGTAARGASGACTSHSPVLRVAEPHAPLPCSAPARRRSNLQAKLPPSVTAVSFLDGGSGHAVASGGVDGLVKFWDLRYTVQPTVAVEVPGDARASYASSIAASNANARLLLLAEGGRAHLGQRSYAVTCMAQRPNASQLLVSLTGGHHLLYDTLRPDVGPVRWFGGHTVSSFYVKTAFSPDGSHFISGSSDARACIWQVDGADGGAPYVLRGHDSEVTAAAWCPTDFCQVATAADDYTVKVWNINRKQEDETTDMPGGWVPKPVPVTVEAAVVEKPQRKDAVAAVATTPAAAAAVSTSQLVPPTGRGNYSNSSKKSLMRISDVLRDNLAASVPQAKRTKQQTLAEALSSARAAGALTSKRDSTDGGSEGAPPPKRARSPTETDSPSGAPAAAEQQGLNGGSQGLSGDENRPNNISSSRDSL